VDSEEVDVHAALLQGQLYPELTDIGKNWIYTMVDVIVLANTANCRGN
jgi:hypothetical protein